MKHFFFTFAIIIGTLLSTTLAAPWVVYEGRNDMLALSSEVSEGAVAYAVPPPATTIKSIDDEAVTAEPESVAEINNDVPAHTTEEQPQLDAVAEPEPELGSAETKDVIQTTVKPMEDDAQEDVAEVTTTVSVSSSIGSLLEDDIQSEDMHIKIISDNPIPSTRQNPNSIEKEDQLAALLVVSKKKHEIFSGKKSKFSM